MAKPPPSNPGSVTPEQLREILVFRGMADSDLELLTRNGSLQLYKAGQQVLGEFESPRAFFALLKGSVKVLFSNPGDAREVVVKLFTAPAVFGEIEALMNIPFLERVTTIEPSQIFEIPRAAFLDSLSTSPVFTRAILDDVAARMCMTISNARALAFNDVEARLSNALLDYADLFGVPTPNGVRIRIPLTHSELADSLAVTKRSVIRTLQKWSKEQLVIKERGFVTLRDVAKLKTKADQRLLGLAHSIGRRLRSKGAPPTRG